MTTITLTAPVKRVGNSYAIFIPIEKVREGQLREGDVVQASLSPALPSAFGLLKDLPYRPWGPEDKKWMWPRKPGDE